MGHRLLLDENVMRRKLRVPLLSRIDGLAATSPASTGSGSQRGRSHAGIIVDPNSLLPVGEMLRRMTRLLADFEEQSLAGKLVYLSDYR